MILHFFLTISLIYASNCQKQSILLWEFRPCEDCKTSYLLASLHVPAELLWDRLPSQIFRVLNVTDVFVTEMEEVSPESSTCVFRHKSSLATLITDATKSKLKEKLLGTSLSSSFINQIMENLQQMRWWAGLTQWSAIYSLKALPDEEILDLKLQSYVSSKGKDVRGVETIQEQCDSWDRFESTDPEVAEALAKLLLIGSDSTKSAMSDILENFICGEISQMFEQYELQNFVNLTTLKEKYLDVHTRKKLDEALENLMNALFVERKRRMVDKVIAMTTTEPSRTFTFSFGPMYFTDDDGIHSDLISMGIPLIQVRRDDFIPTMRLGLHRVFSGWLFWSPLTPMQMIIAVLIIILACFFLIYVPLHSQYRAIDIHDETELAIAVETKRLHATIETPRHNMFET